MKRFIVVLVLFGLVPAPAFALDLKLSCEGTGIYSAHESQSVTLFGGGQTVNGSGSSSHKEQVTSRVRLEIADAGARVKLPRPLIPTLNAGDKEGWFKLKDVAVEEQKIRGRFNLNVLSNPSVTIDRKSGEVEIAGLSISFSGTCAKAEDEALKF